MNDLLIPQTAASNTGGSHVDGSAVRADYPDRGPGEGKASGLSPLVAEKIEECWRRGDSIADARKSVELCCGVKIGFEDAHPIFVRLAREWAL